MLCLCLCPPRLGSQGFPGVPAIPQRPLSGTPSVHTCTQRDEASLTESSQRDRAAAGCCRPPAPKARAPPRPRVHDDVCQHMDGDPARWTHPASPVEKPPLVHREAEQSPKRPRTALSAAHRAHRAHRVVHGQRGQSPKRRHAQQKSVMNNPKIQIVLLDPRSDDPYMNITIIKRIRASASATLAER